MPVGPSPRNGRSEFMSGPRIPGAFYFDIDDVSLPSSSNPKNLPHMKPPQKVFSLAMDQMGITPDDTLYVYASEGCGFVHRAYWTLRSCGHNPEKVRLVQGSFKEWKECEGKLEYEELTEGDGRLFRMKDVDIENATPKYKCWNKDEGNDSKEEKNVVTMSEVLDVVKQSKMGEGGIIVDARSAGRFVGTEPEVSKFCCRDCRKSIFNLMIVVDYLFVFFCKSPVLVYVEGICREHSMFPSCLYWIRMTKPNLSRWLKLKRYL